MKYFSIFQFTYDEIGRLKSRINASGPTYLKYDVTGKITGIYTDATFSNLMIGYTYDESGNRISSVDQMGSQPITTYYVYDASGNVLAIYTQSGSGTPQLAEQPVYGSSRLGTYYTQANNYVYEIRDNVGSVRVVLNRNKNSTTGQADIYKYNDYYPFGSNLGRNGGSTYRYDYQGAYSEKDQITGYNNFELRMYDSRIGRWLSTDPAGQFASPYEGMGNNPVRGIDKDGGDETSVHVDKYLNVIANFDDGDNGVYLHNDGILHDYSKLNTSGGGISLGVLGGTININGTFDNLLQRDGKLAEGLTSPGWIANVLPHSVWDLKNNKSTIFGVAWAYDQDIKSQTGLDNDTFFIYQGFSETVNGVMKFTAADVGNFHAGYTGIAAGISRQTQYNLAGIGESINGTGSWSQLWNGVPPYGDRPIDYQWNTFGMNVAQSQGLHNTRVTNPSIYYHP